MGLTVIDAGVAIGLLNAADTHHSAAESTLTEVRDRGDQIELPASAYAECLVGPIRSGEASIDAVRAFVSQLPLWIVPLDTSIAEAAARLRAVHGARLHLTDVLVIATAIVLEADVLLTTDRGWPRRSIFGLRAQLSQL